MMLTLIQVMAIELDYFHMIAALSCSNIWIIINSVFVLFYFFLFGLLSFDNDWAVPEGYVPKRKRKRKPPKFSLIKRINQIVTGLADRAERRLNKDLRYYKHRRRPLSMSVRFIYKVIKARCRQPFGRSKRRARMSRVFAYTSHKFTYHHYPDPYDSDSGPLIVDNGCSASMSPYLSDFIGKLTKCNVKVDGFGGGSVGATHKGTIRWILQDDVGVGHPIYIKNAYYCPDAPCRMLSPQHWAQSKGDHSPNPEGTGCTTTSQEVVLYWDQRKYVKTIRLDKATNVGITATAPCYKKFKAYMVSLESDCSEQHTTIMLPALIEDDESSQALGDEEAIFDDDNLSFSEPIAGKKWNAVKEPPHSLQTELHGSANDNQPLQATYSDLPRPTVIPEDEEPMYLSPQDELLRWHYRLGHLPFRRIKKMCLQGDLPKRLLEVKPPFCRRIHSTLLKCRSMKLNFSRLSRVSFESRETESYSIDVIGRIS
jgi:hypothetical protein